MPSSSSHASSPETHRLEPLLGSIRPFLRGELEKVNPDLPSLISVLRSVGAGECWHKHGTFLDHLVDIYRILKIWKAQEPVCLCGLFHSAYSNSYVNLAIFNPSTGRDVVRGHVGEAAERLIHLFCIVPRQSLIHDDLLFHYSDSELVDHLKFSNTSLKNALENGHLNEDETWRKKLQSILPANGVTVKHIKTGEDVTVSRRVVAIFLMMTVADFSDQLFGFQDSLFENTNGRLEFPGNNYKSLWPGNGKPGLWMNSASRMGAIYTLIAREESILIAQRKRNNELGLKTERDEELELVIPPIFENCTRILDADDQITARDLYWEGVCEKSDRSEELLLKCVMKNPFIGEPHVALGQLYLGEGRFEEAEKEAEEGLRLMLTWGSAWDKRMPWEGWIAWGRVLLMKAKEKTWPNTSWGILNLGLVK
ncbi:Tetratricopeptide-like helical [Cucumis melo var. makuwa]|uniref:Tetratricopeptide-like helical n=1 Tax=Cucumis melo var. makuwa TaxID=1194695 RepID=A0A5D3CUK7_CUCMM|nr:Tetratricopeptide-like helical [Cucumis melo var. makuwa]TYK15152.1 Tetratricopeptide-like helical [Cucumis melo var. makuwa]